METVLTIAAGVALGILIAFAVIRWGLWLPTTVSTARQLVLITYSRRKALPLLVIVATTALAALFALYRAEKTMREAEGFNISIVDQPKQDATADRVSNTPLFGAWRECPRRRLPPGEYHRGPCRR